MLATLAFALLAGFSTAAPLSVAVEFDPKNLVYIVSGRDNTCLSIGGGNKQKAFDGLKVISVECQYANTWILKPETGTILLTTDPSFALDAGVTPSNNGELKIWTSFPGITQQNWTQTAEGHFELPNNQCLDEGDGGVQIYQCTKGNTNQVWKTLAWNTTTADLPSATVTFVESWTVPNGYSNTDAPYTGPLPTATVTYDGCGPPPAEESGVLYEGVCSTIPAWLATATANEVKQTGQ